MKYLNHKIPTFVAAATSVLLMVLALTAQADAAPAVEAADLVFTNGKVYTVNPDQPCRRARQRDRLRRRQRRCGSTGRRSDTEN